MNQPALKQYPGMSGNSTGAVSGAANSRRDDYTVNEQTWFPMQPFHNPPPELLERAKRLCVKAWRLEVRVGDLLEKDMQIGDLPILVADLAAFAESIHNEIYKQTNGEAKS